MLTMYPNPHVISLFAIWQGFTGTLTGIASISLIQIVAPKKSSVQWVSDASDGRGKRIRPNSWSLTDLLQRIRIARAGEQLVQVLVATAQSETHEVGGPVGELRADILDPDRYTLLCGVLIGLWRQRPDRFEHTPSPGWSQTLTDLKRLSCQPRFWALVATICLLGCPVFQTANQFLPYCAKELGLVQPGVVIPAVYYSAS